MNIILRSTIFLGLASSLLFAQKINPPPMPPPPDPPSACDAIAGNLVANCGFETGTFSSWTQSGNTGATGVNTGFYAHTGTYGAQLGPVGSLGFLSQTLATTAGDTYDLSYWLENVVADPSATFNVYWNGTLITHEQPVPAGPYTVPTDLPGLVATGSSSVLEFGFQQNPSYLGLDDITVLDTSVAGAPEPKSVFQSALLLGLLATLGMIRKRRMSQTS